MQGAAAAEGEEDIDWGPAFKPVVELSRVMSSGFVGLISPNARVRDGTAEAQEPAPLSPRSPRRDEEVPVLNPLEQAAAGVWSLFSPGPAQPQAAARDEEVAE